MSYFDDASLVMIPSGYKDQKVYSVKPIDGSGDLTFSRASNATRVNSSGLVEKVRTNEALYSEQLDNAVYTKTYGSVTANATTAPNGTATADKFYEDTTNDIHRILQDGLPYTSGNEITFSVYAKPDGRNKIELRMFDFSSNFASVYFDISAGTILSTIAGVGTITDAGSGWFRCSVTAPASATSANGLALVYLLNASGLDSYAGDGTSGAFLWGYQVETGVATDYIATTSSAVSVGPVSGLPRLDYSGGASCPSLLLEPQTTALNQYSEQIDNGYWGKNAVTIVANNATSPSGYQDADLMYPSSAGISRYILKFVGATSGLTYTTSVFAKASGKNWLGMANVDSGSTTAWFNLATGTVGTVLAGTTATITDYGNGWYRCTVTRTAATTTGAVILLVEDADNSDSITPNGTDGILLWGINLTQSAYATSYIPTLSTAVTRVVDDCVKTSATSIIGQTEGVAYIDFDFTGNYSTSGIIPISIDNGSGFEMYFWVQTTGTAIFDVYNTTQQVSISGIIGAVGRKKVAIAYKQNDFALYINGVQIGTDTSGTVPATNRLYVGRYYANTSYNMTSGVNQFLLFPTRLSNADLATLTTI